MKNLHCPVIVLPDEFIHLLKMNVTSLSQPQVIVQTLQTNKALVMILETALAEFSDGRGIEKILNVLGWANFRDRMASVYISKRLHGDYPKKTNMELIEDIKKVEQRFSDYGVSSSSRAFLLGFYLKLANIELAEKVAHEDNGLVISDDLAPILKLSQGRSDRIDWLVLIVLHLHQTFGPKSLANHILAGRRLNDLYPLMPYEARELMHENLLAYGASIQESDLFLYEKI